MLWPGTKHASMNFKEKYRNYMHKTVSECLVCGIGARVVPLRARLRPG